MIRKVILASTFALGFIGFAQAEPVVNTKPLDCSSCPVEGSIQMAQLDPRTAVPRTVGQAVNIGDVRNFEDPNNIRICCPPVAMTPSAYQSMFRVHQLPGKNSTQSYGLQFLPTAALDNQMSSFAHYLSNWTPSGYTMNSLLVVGQIKAVTPTGPIVNSVQIPQASDFASGTDVSSGYHALRGWWNASPWTPPTSIWTGPSGSFANSYSDGSSSNFLASGHLKPGQWYLMHIKYQMAVKKLPLPNDTWEQRDVICSNAKDQYVAILVAAPAVARVGTPPPAASVATIIQLN